VGNLNQAKIKLGDEDSHQDMLDSHDYIKQTLLAAVKKSFKPEFVNRLDSIIVFNPLSYEDLTKIAKIYITALNKKLSANALKLKVTESALRYLIDKGYNPEYGARPLRRVIEQDVEDRIAEDMLDGKIKPNKTIVVGFKNGALSLGIS